jgi:hypothetical protein
LHNHNFGLRSGCRAGGEATPRWHESDPALA